MIWWMPDGLLFDFTADDHCGSAHIVPTLALSATSTVYPSGERIMNIRAGDRRHPETLPYRCCLSTLAGFGRLCRAGPARTWARIIEVRGCVNQGISRCVKFVSQNVEYQFFLLYIIFCDLRKKILLSTIYANLHE